MKVAARIVNESIPDTADGYSVLAFPYRRALIQCIADALDQEGSWIDSHSTKASATTASDSKGVIDDERDASIRQW